MIDTNTEKLEEDKAVRVPAIPGEREDDEIITPNDDDKSGGSTQPDKPGSAEKRYQEDPSKPGSPDKPRDPNAPVIVPPPHTDQPRLH